MSVEDERVMTFRRERYGRNPEPLRSYLTPQDARELLHEFPPALPVFSDMDIQGYRSRFARAVEQGVRTGNDPQTLTFWIAARKWFLESGGEYMAGREPATRRDI